MLLKRSVNKVSSHSKTPAPTKTAPTEACQNGPVTSQTAVYLNFIICM